MRVLLASARNSKGFPGKPRVQRVERFEKERFWARHPHPPSASADGPPLSRRGRGQRVFRRRKTGSSFELRGQDDRRRRALDAFDAADAIGQLVHVRNGGHHAELDQVVGPADRMQRAHRADRTQGGHHRRGLPGAHGDHDLRADMPVFEVVADAHGVAADHAFTLQAFDPALHRGAGQAKPAGDLCGRQPRVLAQQAQQADIGGVIGPVRSGFGDLPRF